MQIIEEKEEVKCFRVDGRCSVCGGILKRDPLVLSSNPPTYKYICTECGDYSMSFENYPRIEYVLVGKEGKQE